VNLVPRALTTRIRIVLFVSMIASALAACPRPGGTVVETPKSSVPASSTLYGLVDVSSIARNAMLQDDLLATYRDRLLRRLGVSAQDALSASGLAEVFALSESAVGAFVPGFGAQGAMVRQYRGQNVVTLGDSGLEGARVSGGSVVGQSAAVSAALDVAYGSAPALGASPLRTLVADAPEFKTIRLATSSPAQLFSMLPAGPPANVTGALSTAAAYVTLEGTVLTARVTAAARDAEAATSLASWVEGQRKGFRATLAHWRESAGLFGSALTPAIHALDAIKVEVRGHTVWVVTHQDLKPIFSSGLMMLLRTLKAFGQ
jgi:hypothetical protein